MERRRFFMTALATASVSSARCIVTDAPRRETKSDLPTAAEWGNLSPLRRIQELELKRFPQAAGLEPHSELVKAVAQFYCANARCTDGADNVTATVEIVTPDHIVRTIEDIFSRPLTAAEKDMFAKWLEVIDPRTGKVLISPAAISADVADTQRTAPQNVERVKPKDYETIVQKSVLMHAFTHLRASKEKVLVPIMPVEGRNFIITGMEGFVFTGVQRNGKPGFMTGFLEALTEYESIVMKQKTGDYASTTNYAEGVKLVSLLNQAAKIPPEQFKEYYEGQKKFHELLAKWGGLRRFAMEGGLTNEEAALQAAVIIALRVELPQALSQEKAITAIRGLGIPV